MRLLLPPMFNMYELNSDILNLDFKKLNLTLNQAESILDYNDCFDIAKSVYFKGDLYNTIIWAELAKKKLKENWENTDDQNYLAYEIFDYLSYCYSQNNLNEKSYEYVRAALSHVKKDDNENYKRLMNNHDYYKHKYFGGKKAKGDPLTHEDFRKPFKDHPAVERDYFSGGNLFDPKTLSSSFGLERIEERPEMWHYENLCRIDNLYDSLNKTHKNQLFCTYWTENNNPLLIFKPIKAEIIHLKPTVVIYREFISKDEVKKVINNEKIKSKLNRATIVDPFTGIQRAADYRVSKSAWFPYGSDKTMDKITDRVHQVTGLDNTHTENFQISNYGLGGQYTPHYDASRPTDAADENPETGNRIATMLMYFETPLAGGSTIFTELGLAVPATAGDALFWYNLMPNGSLDWGTRHAACPVLAGFKTVSNLWLHIRGNEFRRQCLINENDSSTLNILGHDRFRSTFQNW